MSNNINIAIVGLGQIGIYLYNELRLKKKDIEKKTGKKIQIVAISARNKNFFAWRPSVWGFGTWKRSWIECKQFMSKSNKLNFNYEFKKNLSKHGNDLHIALGKNIIKKQSTFGVWWAVSIIIKKGLNLYPSETLVENNGFDGSGVNCSDTNFFKQRLNKKFKFKIMSNLIEPDIKFSSKISKKILYSKTESYLYLFLNPNIAFNIISSYIFLKKKYYKFFSD